MNTLIYRFVFIFTVIYVLYCVFLWLRYVHNKSLTVSIDYFSSLLETASNKKQALKGANNDISVENVNFDPENFKFSNELICSLLK